MFVFVYIGKYSSENTKQQTLKLGKEYCDEKNVKQKMKNKCVVVMQGKEPFVFTSNFRGWSNNRIRASTIRGRDIGGI